MATVEINGQSLEAEVGQMIIEVADEAGIHIPRFCYHKKLSIAANCRMCLVEIENGRKPMPACATPISDGMKVYTQTPMALEAQKAVMEFLLINHPLDCPICDQGGECELQDVAMGYGSDVSRYSEAKRVVDDDDIGSLIATDMTRCIHCTRCVRFGEEIAGMRELGATGRGENMKIGTFIKHSMHSEVSGNIIDLCPVGALTSKPYRFTARAWELKQYVSIAPHDSLGSNVFVHARNQKVMRVVPKTNERINAMWLSDRDRFSYLALNSADRVTKPLIKKKGRWVETDWQTALGQTAAMLQQVVKEQGARQLAAWVSPNATLEEGYLLQKIMRALGTHNIDSRIKEIDFADQQEAPLHYTMDLSIDELEQQQAILLLGSHLTHEQPLAATRVRRALRFDATAMAINPRDVDFHFPIKEKLITNTMEMPHTFAEVAAALVQQGCETSSDIAASLSSITPSETAQSMAKLLRENERSVVIVGAFAMQHPQASALRALARLIAHLSGAKLAMMTSGANAAGTAIAGVLPHRGVAGRSSAETGLDWQQSIDNPRKAYVLWGVEPELDCADPAGARQALAQADFVVAFSPFQNEAMREYADIILPIAPFTETSGTYVNNVGIWQSFQGSVKPLGDVRPGWKVLRVLGNLLGYGDFEYESSIAIRDEVKALCDQHPFDSDTPLRVPALLPTDDVLRLVTTWPIYATDNIVRRSQALQESATVEPLAIRVHPEVAKQFNLRHSREATVIHNGAEITLPVVIDGGVATYSVHMPRGYQETAILGKSFSTIDLK